MKCKFKKKTGKKCQANAMKNGYCYRHNPELEQVRHENDYKGGKANSYNSNPLDPVEIKSMDDVVKLLTDTINNVRAGGIEIRVSNNIGYLAGHLIKAIEKTDLETRLEKLEEIYNNK